MNEFILQNKLKVQFSPFISILGASSRTPLFMCVCGGGCFAFFFFRVNERLQAALESAKIAPLDADKLFGGGRLRRRADDAFCCRGRACLQCDRRSVTVWFLITCVTLKSLYNKRVSDSEGVASKKQINKKIPMSWMD